VNSVEEQVGVGWMRDSFFDEVGCDSSEVFEQEVNSALAMSTEITKRICVRIQGTLALWN
jgi:hypothetical protein